MISVFYSMLMLQFLLSQLHTRCCHPDEGGTLGTTKIMLQPSRKKIDDCSNPTQSFTRFIWKRYTSV